MDALLDLLLTGSITQDDYSSKRDQLAAKLIKSRENLASIEDQTRTPLERDKWLFTWLNKALALAQDPNPVENLIFLKIIGSNLKIHNGHVLLTLKKPWNLAVELNTRVASGELKPFSKDTNRLLCRILDAARTVAGENTTSLPLTVTADEPSHRQLAWSSTIVPSLDRC